VNQAFRDKIIELFEYRKLPTLISYGGHLWDEQYYEMLIQLQYDIYLLDEVLESHWEVDMDIIADKWVDIHDDLRALSVPEHMIDKYCNHIYKYQRHELDLRRGKLPTRLSMEYFYFYKSCDVKLLRRLIYDHNPQLSRLIPTADWRLFDLVTEINDDVVDLQEDVTTINGNRFLISYLQYGKETTVGTFYSYLDDLQLRNDQREPSPSVLDYNQWTTDQIRATKDLVLSQAEQFDKVDLSLYNTYLGLVSV